ncbi:MAG: hypothetical protein M1820_005773 [Bogoriella megaspora]|nr:MAG: hypothetical protein M1820_005773 [Bogoriella megaspora]
MAPQTKTLAAIGTEFAQRSSEINAAFAVLRSDFERVQRLNFEFNQFIAQRFPKLGLDIDNAYNALPPVPYPRNVLPLADRQESAETAASVEQKPTQTLTQANKRRKTNRPYKKKDPNHPKRPLTPYFMFLKQARSLIKAELEQKKDGEIVSNAELSAEATRRFRELSTEERAQWDKVYADNKKTYDAQVAAYKRQQGEQDAEAGASKQDEENNDIEDEEEAEEEEKDDSTPNNDDSRPNELATQLRSAAAVNLSDDNDTGDEKSDESSDEEVEEEQAPVKPKESSPEKEASPPKVKNKAPKPTTTTKVPLPAPTSATVQPAQAAPTPSKQPPAAKQKSKKNTSAPIPPVAPDANPPPAAVNGGLPSVDENNIDPRLRDQGTQQAVTEQSTVEQPTTEQAKRKADTQETTTAAPKKKKVKKAKDGSQQQMSSTPVPSSQAVVSASSPPPPVTETPKQPPTTEVKKKKKKSHAQPQSQSQPTA